MKHQALLLAMAMILLLASPSGAGVSVDASLGEPGAILGPDYLIPAERGSQLGGNLFHSFADFSLAAGESATFTGPSSVDNIIARVTGGLPSTIDGLLRSTIPGANLFLLNPSGVLFGPQASLDLSGSLSISTADYLTLGSQGRFAALAEGDSQLTVDPPVAFGFLADAPARITIVGSDLVVGATPGPVEAEGKSLSLLGGDIEISSASISAPGGRISLVSLGSAGEVSLADGQISGASSLGEMTLTDGASIDVSGNGGGKVLVRAKHCVLQDATFLSETTGDVAGQGVDLGVSSLAILGEGGIETTTYGSGDGGSIVVRADTLSIADTGHLSAQIGAGASGHGGDIMVKAADSVALSGQGYLSVSSWGAGDGGAMVVETGHVSLCDQSSLESGLGPGSLGNGGSIAVEAKSLLVADGAYLSGAVYPGAKGHGGEISVRGAETIGISGGGYLSNATWGQGQGGSIVLAAKQLTLADQGSIETGVGEGGTGHGGDIHIVGAKTVRLSEEGKIDVSTWGAGDSGKITVQTEVLTLADAATIGGQVAPGATGNGGDTVIEEAKSVALTGESGVTVSTWGTGDSGSIRLQTEVLTLSDSALLSASVMDGASGHGGDIVIHDAGVVTLGGERGLNTSTYGSGDGGAIVVQAKDLNISDAAYLGAEVGAGGTGHGGGVRIEAEAVRLSGEGLISATSYGEGDSGAIQVAASTLSVADHGSIQAAGKGLGRGGDIDLVVSRLALLGGAISAESVSPGLAGDIYIQAGDGVELRNNSSISTSALAADGGNIEIQAGRLLLLDHSALTTSVLVGESHGGNISIDPSYVILKESQIVAQAYGGSGGQIHIAAGTVIQDPATLISASSVLGVDGEVMVDAPSMDLSGTMAVLPSAFLPEVDLPMTRCAVRQPNVGSSLVLEGDDLGGDEIGEPAP